MSATESRALPPLDPAQVREVVRRALAEDLGPGDATTLAVVPADCRIRAALNTREPCVVAGLPVVAAVFQELAPDVTLDDAVRDGTACPAGAVLATVVGPARAILTGERTALNFLQRLSGIATLTRRYVEALGNSPAKLLDTRKTTPGLRRLEKYAVVAGGGSNHRLGLYDRIMIKDNHRYLAQLQGPGGLARAVAECRRRYPELEIEVEADTLADVQEALACGVEYVLLDNMDNAQIRRAVALRQARAPGVRLEASGGITLARLPELGQTGVDFISVGALTHSARAIDIGLDLELPG